MKKILVFIGLSLALVFSLSGCDIELNVPPKDGNVVTSNNSASEISSNDNSQAVISGGVINREKAIEIALNHAGLTEAQVRNITADFDKELNRNEWDVEFDYENYEYSYEINADTSEIIKSEKDVEDDR